jgi:hypothetical protein
LERVWIGNLFGTWRAGTSIRWWATSTLNGNVPELSIDFSNGWRLITAAMLPDGAEWSIRLGENVYLSAAEGILLLGEGAEPGLTDVEKTEFAHAEVTAQRWGCPIVAPKRGACKDCKWMRSIDGDANFLDYGVCTAPDSPLDGRVVNRDSGCAAFCLH